MSIIQVRELRKSYFVPEREAGLMAAFRSLVNRKTREIKAVDGISFEIQAGEMVGFLGPNGAGKTTSLKMLSGLLHPTGGTGTVLGFTPYQRQRAYLTQMTLVMGQRNQLIWDIPAADSYELNRAMYAIPRDQYRQTLQELDDLLELGPLLTKPVRNLSLGERMKVEIAGSLLHRPKVLFLDEPTIGLDVTAQRRIRAFLKEYNARHGATVLLTSHYMADVEELCKRIIVIHHGRVIFEGDLSDLAEQFSAHKTIVITAGEQPLHAADLSRYGEVLEATPETATLKVPKRESTSITGRLLAELALSDVTISEPPIEDAIEQIFATPAA